MEPSLELQKAIRGKLVAASAVISLVPAESILDSNGLPSVFPCILIGEGQSVAGSDIARRRHDCYLDLHVWTEEPGLVHSKAISGAIRGALFDAVWTVPGIHVADLHITQSRFMRDPDGKHGHAVVSITAMVKETA